MSPRSPTSPRRPASPRSRAETQSPCMAAAGWAGRAAMATEPPEPGVGVRGAAGLAAFVRSCTLHGLGRVFAPGAPAPHRLLWAGAFLASLGTFLLQAGERVRHYATYPRVTVLDEAESRVLVFPAVTLCNYNRVRRSQLTPDDLFWLGGELLAVGREDVPRYLQALGQPPDLAGFFPSKSYDLGAFYQRAGHPIHEMLLRCRFRGRDCGPENFTAVSASATASATATAGCAPGRTHGSPSPGWLCPGQGLGRTPGAEQVLGPRGVQAVGWSAVGRWRGAGCGMVGCVRSAGPWGARAVGRRRGGGTAPARPAVPQPQALGEAPTALRRDGSSHPPCAHGAVGKRGGDGESWGGCGAAAQA
ncbi:uncharacterized protein LOC142600839 [Balearica regulorum gibbericeps]|uniref:uncharacterized protein LOC142600839 n=1 Tax=Balearica regulorum gibbericeps TaxID=100784 RepID=UPI003F62E206